jgi:glycosyltransferase involved in cell wall biosynthesis
MLHNRSIGQGASDRPRNVRAEPAEIVFLFNVGRVERLGRTAPEEFFYGFRILHRFGLFARLVGPHPPSQGVIDDRGRIYAPGAVFVWLLRRLKGTPLAFVTRLIQCLHILPLLRNANCIVPVTSPWTHAVGLLRRLRLVRAPVVAIAVGPYPPAIGVRQKLVARTKRFLYAGTNLVFLGEPDRLSFLENVGTASPTYTIPFGIDHEFWSPVDDPPGNYGFSIGNAGRDYATLALAWGTRTDPLRVVSALKRPQAAGPAVEWAHGIWHDPKLTDEDVRGLYRTARFVVTPLFESTQPCGQSATLQAMACGKAVILTRTAGLWDDEVMRDGYNCLLVPPGDSAALARAIDRLLGDPAEAARLGANARRTVVDHYTTEGFVSALVGLIGRQGAAGAVPRG